MCTQTPPLPHTPTHQSPLPVHVTAHSPSLAGEHTRRHFTATLSPADSFFYHYIFAPPETSHLDFKVGWCTMRQMPYISSHSLQVQHSSVKNIEYNEACMWVISITFSYVSVRERDLRSEKWIHEKKVWQKCWNFVVGYVLELSISAGHLCICKNWLKTRTFQGFLLIVTLLLFFFFFWCLLKMQICSILLLLSLVKCGEEQHYFFSVWTIH